MKVTLKIGYDTFYSMELADAAKVMELLGKAQAFESRWGHKGSHNVEIVQETEIVSKEPKLITREAFDALQGETETPAED